MFELFLEKLRIGLEKPLPGFKAHKSMIPDNREYKLTDENYTKSAVNIILYPNNGLENFILTKRSSKMSHHSGQISLPGGKKDAVDKDLWETAKRETLEETNIVIKDENYLGKLSPLLIPVSKFNVQPFISVIDKKPDTPARTNEVEKFFFVNISDFFSVDNFSKKTFFFNGKSFITPCYKLEGEIVWGATAMILAEFSQIILEFA
ncbi:MAG: CoA pyrophosphatase [Bacteroidales bacterium]|nr:CoA pyrophosphatase [Bacteroidales bacterium]